MTGRRWTYKVVKVKPQMLGVRPETIESVLAPLGQAGWELVNAVQLGVYTMLYLKKEI
jgi:hypothetical protein